MRIEGFRIGRYSERLNIDLNERKIVKTISIKKRVALVVATALSFGGLTAVSAHAGSATGVTFSSGVLSCKVPTGENPTTTTVVLVGGYVTATLTSTSASGDYITTTGPFALSTADGTNLTVTNATKATQGTTTGGTVRVTATGLGTGTVAVYATGGSLVSTVNISAVASCDSGVSAANSFVQLTDAASKVWTTANLAAGSTSGTTDAAAVLDNSVDYANSFAVGTSGYSK